MGYRAKTWDGSQWIDLGSNGIDSSMYAWIAFPTTMRTAPSINSSTGTDYYLLDRLGAVDYFNSFGQGSKTTAGSWIYNNTEMTSSTAGAAGLVQGYSANSYLGFSADL